MLDIRCYDMGLHNMMLYHATSFNSLRGGHTLTYTDIVDKAIVIH